MNTNDILLYREGLAACGWSVIRTDELAELRTVLDEARNSLNAMLDDANVIGRRRGYGSFLGGLAVLHHLDDDLSTACTALDEVIELAEEGIGYTSSYFREKWHMNEKLAELKKIVTKLSEARK